jgi:hypothetical protein
MRARILLGIMFAVLLGVRAAFPQAAAESAMLNAHSSATAAKAGSVLGEALNKATNNIAGQIQTVPKSTAVNGKIQHIQPPKTQPAGAATAPGSASGASASGTSMITSIRGIRKNCVAASPGASTQGPGTPAGNASKSTDCRAPQALPGSPASTR